MSVTRCDCCRATIEEERQHRPFGPYGRVFCDYCALAEQQFYVIDFQKRVEAIEAELALMKRSLTAEPALRLDYVGTTKQGGATRDKK